MESAEQGRFHNLILTEEQAVVLRRVLEYWYPFVDDDPPAGSDEYVVNQIASLLPDPVSSDVHPVVTSVAAA